MLQLGPEVLPPGPAGNGKGIETLGSLPLVAPSLPLSVSGAEQGWSPPLLGPGRSRSRWKGRMRTGVGVEGGQKGKSHWRSVNQREDRLSDYGRISQPEAYDRGQDWWGRGLKERDRPTYRVGTLSWDRRAYIEW